MRRLPPPAQRLRETGTEPDYRFSLANERTMLAYLRTALALIVAGAALLQFFDHPLENATGTGLIVLGIGIAAGSYRRWRRIEAALRRNEPLPFSRVPRLVASCLAIAGTVLLFARVCAS